MGRRQGGAPGADVPALGFSSGRMLRSTAEHDFAYGCVIVTRLLSPKRISHANNAKGMISGIGEGKVLSFPH
jgi:hypothetical protein